MKVKSFALNVFPFPLYPNVHMLKCSQQWRPPSPYHCLKDPFKMHLTIPFSLLDSAQPKSLQIPSQPYTPPSPELSHSSKLFSRKTQSQSPATASRMATNPSNPFAKDLSAIMSQMTRLSLQPQLYAYPSQENSTAMRSLCVPAPLFLLSKLTNSIQNPRPPLHPIRPHPPRIQRAQHRPTL